jgi:hypothetical protein
MYQTTRKPDAHKPNKALRLAEALRENLRKRKAQSRARRGGAGVGAKGAQDRPDSDKALNDTGIDD